MWLGLNRCHNNALTREKKKQEKASEYNYQANLEGRWKFAEKMEFLLPVKNFRLRKSNLLGKFENYAKSADTLETTDDADINNQSMNTMKIKFEEGDDEEEEEEEDDYNDKEISNDILLDRTYTSVKETKKPKKRKVEVSDEGSLSLLNVKSDDKQEYHRAASFFHSIMHRVESLDDENFEEFQIETLQLLKRLRSKRAQEMQTLQQGQSLSQQAQSRGISEQSLGLPSSSLNQSGSLPRTSQEQKTFITGIWASHGSNHM